MSGTPSSSSSTKDETTNTIVFSNSNNSSGLYLKVDGPPKLKGQSNYQMWAGSWRSVSKAAKWWKVVSGDTKQPESKNSDRYKEWEDIDSKAHVFLLTATIEDIQPTVISADSAHSAWKLLKDLYDQLNQLRPRPL